MSQMLKANNESGAFFRALLENACELVVVHDQRGFYRYVGPTAFKILGYHASEMLGKRAKTFMHPDDYLWVNQSLAAFFQTPGAVQRIKPYRVRHANGEWRYFEAIATNLLDNPDVQGLVVNAYDVTDRELAYQKLEREHDFASQVMNALGQGLVISNRDAVIEFINPAYSQLLGYAPEELIGQSLFKLTPPEELAHLEQVRQRRTKGEPSTYEMWFNKRDGTKIYVTVSGVPRWQDGEIVGSIAVITDLTEHHRAEAELRTSQELYRTLMAHFPNGAIFLFDHNLRYTLADGAGLRQAGYMPGQLIGKTLWEALPERAAELEPYYRAALAGKSSTFEVKHSNNQTDLVQAVPVRDSDEQVIAGMLISQNITAQKQAEEALQRSQTALLQMQKMESIGRLAGGVAHDFNNLLTSILGYADLLLIDLPKDDPARADVLEIKQAGERGSALTRQLLAFSSRQVLQPKVLNLNEIVGGIAKLLQRLIGEDVKLVNHYADDLWPVKADPSQLEQVLMNLAVNARDAMPEGGRLEIITDNVSLSATRHAVPGPIPTGNYVRFSVSDNGSGMNEATINQIFEPFFTTKAPGKGTGLGLATVFGIIRQSEGYIEVQSQLGVGTTFRIYLPPVLDETLPKSERIGTGELPGGKETILLIDDDVVVRALAAKILERGGYHVLLARGAEEALAICRGHNGTIDLVLTDVVMPGMNGLELVTSIKALLPTIRVIYMSGYDGGIIGEEILSQSTVSFIQKPFTAARLLGEIRATLDAAPSSK